MSQFQSVSVREARSNFSEIIERSFYRQELFQVERNGKPISWLVGEPFMNALIKVMKSDKSLRETLEIMADEELMKTLRQSQQEWSQDKKIPFEEAFA